MLLSIAPLACGGPADSGLQSDAGEKVPCMASASRPICDGSSGLRLAARWQVKRVDPFASVLYELGDHYLFVDGRCHYWAHDTQTTGELSAWFPVREGDLSPQTEAALAADVCYAEWEALSGRWGLTDISDPVPIIFHDAQLAIGCRSPCEVPASRDDPAKFAKVRYMYRTQNAWVTRLYAEGVPMTDPLRIAVFEQRDNQLPGLRRVVWPASMRIENFLVPPAVAGPGQSRLIEDANDVLALRGLRDSYLAGRLGFIGFGTIAIENADEPGAALYMLFIRDAVRPLEDNTGLIPYPPFPP